MFFLTICSWYVSIFKNKILNYIFYLYCFYYKTNILRNGLVGDMERVVHHSVVNPIVSSFRDIYERQFYYIEIFLLTCMDLPPGTKESLTFKKVQWWESEFCDAVYTLQCPLFGLPLLCSIPVSRFHPIRTIPSQSIEIISVLRSIRNLKCKTPSRGI